MSETAWEIALPDGYRLHDVLTFHQRDTESVAEQVTPQRLRKGVMLADTPVLLDVAFDIGSGGAVARCTAQVDGAPTAAVDSAIREALRSVLGLRIDPQPFTDMVADDPVMGPVVQRQPGLRIVQSATVFEALTWAVIGQQINLAFAIALRRTFIQLAGPRHSGGLWCYPDAAGAARLSVEELTSRKFSRAKAETLLRLATLVADGTLDLAPGPANSMADISGALLAVKGIGPWTVNYGLLRGYGYEDCSLHGDVAIRTALHALLGGDARPDIAATERILQRYAPHRTMAAAHLWASLHPRGDGNG